MTEKVQKIRAKNLIRMAIVQEMEAEMERDSILREEQRRPLLRFLRRRRGLPEPKITVEQAIEITRDYFVNVEGYPESVRKVPLLVTSTLQSYEIRPVSMGAGFVSVKVDMTDGRIYDVIAPEIMM